MEKLQRQRVGPHLGKVDSLVCSLRKLQQSSTSFCCSFWLERPRLPVGRYSQQLQCKTMALEYVQPWDTRLEGGGGWLAVTELSYLSIYLIYRLGFTVNVTYFNWKSTILNVCLFFSKPGDLMLFKLFYRFHFFFFKFAIKSETRCQTILYINASVLFVCARLCKAEVSAVR